MWRVFIVFCLVNGALLATFEEQRLQEITLEIATLEKKKEELNQEISANYHKELQLEMKGQKEFIDYKWHAYGESLKEAESAEQSALKKTAELKQINQKLAELLQEKDSLLQKNSDSK